MKISICMPVMGRPRMLCQALHSILLQDFIDLELVIQDGDPVKPVIDEPLVKLLFGLLDVRYVAEHDRGIYDAGNRCFKRATGKILYFMGSDDLLCPGALAAVSIAFEAERFGGPYWLYGKTVSADETGRTLGVDGQPESYSSMLKHNRLGSPAVFWNRRLMELVGGFDTRYHWSAEYELWLRFWRRCEPLFLGQELGVFRHHSGNASQTHVTQLEAECAKIRTRHSTFGKIIDQARNIATVRKAYPDGIPESVN